MSSNETKQIKHSEFKVVLYYFTLYENLIIRDLQNLTNYSIFLYKRKITYIAHVWCPVPGTRVIFGWRHFLSQSCYNCSVRVFINDGMIKIKNSQFRHNSNFARTLHCDIIINTSESHWVSSDNLNISCIFRKLPQLGNRE